jgi:hypothetical protein
VTVILRERKESKKMSNPVDEFSGFLQNQLVYLYHPGTNTWVYGDLSSDPMYTLYSDPGPNQRSIFVMMDEATPTQEMQAKLDFSSPDFAIYDITQGYSNIQYQAKLGWVGNILDQSQTNLVNLYTEGATPQGPIVIVNSSGQPFADTDVVCPSTTFEFYTTQSPIANLTEIRDESGNLQQCVLQAIPVDPKQITDAPSGHQVLYQCSTASGASTATCQLVANVDVPTTWGNNGCDANASAAYLDSSCGQECSGPPPPPPPPPPPSGYECSSNSCVKTNTTPAPYDTLAACKTACGNGPGPGPGPTPPSKLHLSTLEIVGIVTGVVILIILIAGIIVFLVRKSKKKV